MTPLPRPRALAWVAALALFGAAGLATADPPASPGRDEWKYDVVYRKKGRGVPLHGLVIEQGPKHLKMKCITRRPGFPTVVFPEVLETRDVDRVELLDADERKKLQQRLEKLKRDRKVLEEHLTSLRPKGKAPAPLADPLHLREALWPGARGAKAVRFESGYFHLISNARPEVVQFAAIHLEQVYAAYARTLPPRTGKAKPKPTTILLAKSVADYRALAQKRGLALINPAFYDPARNEIVCGSDLDRLRDELEEVRDEHARLRAAIKDRRAALRKAYGGKVPNELLVPLAEAEKRIAAAEAGNEAVFASVSRRLFQVLYHEAFHAYLSTFVYPTADGPLPHWLNEGLAQIFETAIVEAGELRVGHADPARRVAARSALRKGNLPKLTDLLRSGPAQFRVAHGSEKQVSDHYYLGSWALAFYLTFDRKLLGTPKLDAYVQALKRDADPVAAFRTLVGQPLDEFEKEFRQSLLTPRADGGTGP
jgi:hypothetical protein